MTNLDSISKSRDITLPTKVHIVKATVVMYGCESESRSVVSDSSIDYTVHGVARVGHDLATKPPIQTFVSKVISLLFNMLSRFVIAFLPGSKHLLIS